MTFLTIENNSPNIQSDPLIKGDRGQHSQFLRWVGVRRDICHKHHKQRLCKNINTWVKIQFVNVLLVELKNHHIGYWQYLLI